MKNPVAIQTPVFENPIINARLQKRVFLKMECFQPTGSFKARGIGYKCQQAVESGKKHLVSSSGGNAGYTAAYAGRVLGVKTTVVVPENASERARQRIRAEGAELIVQGRVWDESDDYARRLVEEIGGAYIHPFDDPVVWEGHTAIVDECVAQCPKPDTVVVAVGGGGLLVGLVEGMERNGWHDVPVISVETVGAESFAKSIQSGEHITLPAITSIANTLGALRVTAKALEWAKKHPVIPQTVSDRAAVAACLQFADDMRVIVEPACGAALSLLYDNHHLLDDYQNVLVIVCGGAGVTMQQLYDFHARLASG
jgi:L-serine/L-threonine ammonia-lyase